MFFTYKWYIAKGMPKSLLNSVSLVWMKHTCTIYQSNSCGLYNVFYWFRFHGLFQGYMSPFQYKDHVSRSMDSHFKDVLIVDFPYCPKMDHTIYITDKRQYVEHTLPFTIVTSLQYFGHMLQEHKHRTFDHESIHVKNHDHLSNTSAAVLKQIKFIWHHLVLTFLFF